MMPSACRRLLLVVFALSVSAAASAQSLQAQWWKAEPSVKELRLTADQSGRIDGVFQGAIAQLRQQKDDLDRLEAKLSHLIAIDAGEAQVIRQIDHVEATRATLNKTRTLMLLHMRQLLTPEQRVKLTAMHDRWEQEQKQREARPADPPKRPE